MNNRSWKVTEIENSEVFDTGGERLGILVDVLPTGGNDVWVIRSGPSGEREILVPALSSVVREVDVEKKRIVVALPPGLKEIFEEGK
ncbi:MAG: ribosome maturation factor RimM [Endomicrobiales bacterium]